MKFFKTSGFLATSVLALGMASSANADFSGYFDHSNWTITEFGTGSARVDFADANMLILACGNDTSGSFSRIDYTIVVGTGTVDFDWFFGGEDPSTEDSGGYVVNGSYTTLSDTSGELGTESIAVNSGDTFGFWAASEGNLFGEGFLSITNFTAPVPETGTFIALGVGLAALVARRRRK